MVLDWIVDIREVYSPINSLVRTEVGNLGDKKNKKTKRAVWTGQKKRTGKTIKAVILS